jgi:beta-glucosidase
MRSKFILAFLVAGAVNAAAMLGASKNAAAGRPRARQAAAPAAAQPPATMPAFRNPDLAIPDRVADLLGRMTLEEKTAQLFPNRGGGIVDPTGTFTDANLPEIMRNRFQLTNPMSPRRLAILNNGLQRYQVEKTRLGIPTMFFGEALHGFMAARATMFPMPIALASTWDPALLRQVYTAAGNEAAAEGVTQVFAPDLDLGRDPRWGRTEETFGEDPYLVTRMGVAEIEGLQGDRFYIDRRLHVLATAKHFAAHGMPQGGTNTAPVNVSERTLRENFFVPFQAAVEQAHVGSVMASYNEINGVPDHANRWLLTDILRHEWGFRGYVTSDGGGLQDLVNKQHAAANFADAARLALAAGVEYDLSNGDVFKTVLDQVRQGRISEAAIDRAVAPILAAKFRLGLFDHPYVNPDLADSTLNSAAHGRLALQAAEEEIVLLKNEGSLLPLSLDRFHTIAVIGPDAADVHLGGYSRQPAHEVSILDGIRNFVGKRATVLYSEGCKITTDINATTPGWLAWYNNGIELADPAQQKREIAEAAAVAARADAVVLVIGENESIDREAWSLQHLGDRDSLDLFGDQPALVRAIVATGKPIVVVLVNGRPISTNYVSAHVPAILESWYSGQEGGTAVAESLFGAVNPSGKLPITIPRNVGELPDFYNHKPTDNIPWIGTDRTPLYPFGFGLSYTSFRFANLKIDPPEIGTGGSATVSVDVTNTGNRTGVEVAELYTHELVSLVTQPVESLRGFQRVALDPGQTRTLTFTIAPAALAQWDINMHHVVLPGAYQVMIGGSSDDTIAATLQVVAR